MGSKNPKDISDEMAIVVGSLAKLFCGELIGTGKGLFRIYLHAFSFQAWLSF